MEGAQVQFLVRELYPTCYKTQCSQIKHNKKLKLKKKSLKLQSALENNNGRGLELYGKRAILDRAVEKASIGRLHFSDALKEARE